MAIAKGAHAHRWNSSVLMLTAAAAAAAAGSACGAAPAKYGPTAPGAAYGPAPAPYPAAAASGAVAMESGAGVAIDRQISAGGGAAPMPEPERPGLGTTWGEQVSAPISFSPFVRAGDRPWAEVVLHYNDAQGVGSHAAYLGAVPQPLEVAAGDGSLSVALVDDAGRTLPGFHASGRALVVGEDGARYRIVVRNGTTARFEVVASVDGLDVMDGRPADPNRRGYLVEPRGSLVIDGFRTSDAAVAAFRFGRVADSYAAQTSGDRNVGVIGLAIFAERGAVWTPVELHRRDTANPFPQRGYATPPH